MTMTSTATTLTPSCPAVLTVTPNSMPTMPQLHQHIVPLSSHKADATLMPDLWMPRRHQGQPMYINMNVQLDATHVNPSMLTSMLMPTCLLPASTRPLQPPVLTIPLQLPMSNDPTSTTALTTPLHPPTSIPPLLLSTSTIHMTAVIRAIVFGSPVLGPEKDCNWTGPRPQKTGPVVRSFHFWDVKTTKRPV